MKKTTRLIKKKLGRPKVETANPKVRVSLCLCVNTIKMLDAASVRLGRSKSSIVRQLVRDGLAVVVETENTE